MSDRSPQSFSQNTRVSGTSQDIQFLFTERFWDYGVMNLRFFENLSPQGSLRITGESYLSLCSPVASVVDALLARGCGLAKAGVAGQVRRFVGGFPGEV